MNKKRSDHSLEHLLLRAVPKDFPSMFARYKGIRWTLGRTWNRIRYFNAPKDMFGRPFPLEHCLSEVGAGWEPLVRLCYRLVKQEGGSIHQVKEKFGGLRFYAGGVSWAVQLALDGIERGSERICEECGKPGRPRKGGWIKTLCDEHAGGREPFGD